MTELLNGEIVPALSQWEGAALITAAALALGLTSAVRRLRKPARPGTRR